MPPRDSAATRTRLLDAAIAEFSRHGLAGARVDRIAASAQANKRAIYDYFGDKDRLFEAAVATTIDRLNAAVPWTPEDLPGYTARLFDYHRTHPESIRMATWRNLERPNAGPETDHAVYAAFVAMIGSRPGGQDPNALPALDLSVLLLSLAAAWPLANSELLAVEGDDPARPDRVAKHRQCLVDAVSGMLEPTPPCRSRASS